MACRSRWNNGKYIDADYPKLFVFNHFRDVPTVITAAIDNTYDKILHRIDNQCGYTVKQLPNFVAVDFFEVGSAKEVIEELNRRSKNNEGISATPSTKDSPAIAVYNNEIYVVWVEKDDRYGDLIYASFDGSSWSDQHKIPEVSIQTSPVLTVFNDKLYAMWSDYYNDDDQVVRDSIFYASFDGSSWSRPQKLEKLVWKPGETINLPDDTSQPEQPPQENQRRTYTIQAGDTLFDIAQKELGDGNRWREINDANGQPFTEQTAVNIQPGDIIYLPTGTLV